MDSHQNQSVAVSTGAVRSLTTSAPVSGMRIPALLADAKTKGLTLSPAASTTTDAKGEFKISTPAAQDVILEFNHWLYHPTLKGGINVPQGGINDPDVLKTLAMQVPSWLGIYLFAIAMGAAPSKSDHITGVCTNVTEANTTLRDFPHGLPGVKVKLIFEDPELQGLWEKEQKLDDNARATNQKIDLITNVLALFSTLLVLKSRQNKILLALAIGLATKIICAITAWRYLKATVAFSNLGVWQSGFLAGYTNPLDSSALLTTNDGGVLFNLNTMKLPATGAKFRLEASKDGYVFKPITGYAFNNKITIFTHPQCLMAEPNRLYTPKERPYFIT